jgi:hypothetical protein
MKEHMKTNHNFLEMEDEEIYKHFLEDDFCKLHLEKLSMQFFYSLDELKLYKDERYDFSDITDQIRNFYETYMIKIRVYK